jgi:hypothetical protein
MKFSHDHELSGGKPGSEEPRGLVERFWYFWCRTMHDSPMLPFKGPYQCRICHRIHPVPWSPGHEDPPKTGNKV